MAGPVGRPGLRPDKLRGGEGDDTLIGHRGVDILIGGLGRDLARGGPGPDLIRIGAPADAPAAAEAAADEDEVVDDRASGGAGPDRIASRDALVDYVDCGDGRDLAILDNVDVIVDATEENPNGSCERVRRADPDPEPTPEA